MRDPTIFDDGVRLTDVIRIRIPRGFRERVVSVAGAEGIGLAEYARRAIAERMLRSTTAKPSIEGASSAPAPISQESSASPGGTESGGSGRHNHRA